MDAECFWSLVQKAPAGVTFTCWRGLRGHGPSQEHPLAGASPAGSRASSPNRGRTSDEGRISERNWKTTVKNYRRVPNLVTPCYNFISHNHLIKSKHLWGPNAVTPTPPCHAPVRPPNTPSTHRLHFGPRLVP